VLPTVLRASFSIKVLAVAINNALIQAATDVKEQTAIFALNVVVY
jgi:hypothetical protein